MLQSLLADSVQVLLLTALLLPATDPGDACLCYDLVGGKYQPFFKQEKKILR